MITFRKIAKTAQNSKTANIHSPWAYIREGLLSEGYFRLRFWGLFREVLFFFGGGGGGGLHVSSEFCWHCFFLTMSTVIVYFA